jgi:hypothetical protein
MTPSEKAKELILKYEDVEDCDKHYYDRHSPCSHQAKQCAIICVEQIIEAAEKFDEDMAKMYGGWMWPERYWQEVLNILKSS